MNNTIPNLTIIYYCETTEETQLMMTNTTPNTSSIFYTGITEDDKTKMTVNNTTCNLKYPH